MLRPPCGKIQSKNPPPYAGDRTRTAFALPVRASCNKGVIIKRLPIKSFPSSVNSYEILRRLSIQKPSSSNDLSGFSYGWSYKIFLRPYRWRAARYTAASGKPFRACLPQSGNETGKAVCPAHIVSGFGLPVNLRLFPPYSQHLRHYTIGIIIEITTLKGKGQELTVCLSN